MTTQDQPTGRDLRRLSELIRAVESHPGRPAEACKTIPTGWQAEEGERAGSHPFHTLPSGVVHEWFGVVPRDGASRPDDRAWSPPLTLLTHMAWQALNAWTGENRAGGIVVWIGRRCQPYPISLIGPGNDPALLRRSIFVDPPDDASRLWAIELSLRCPGVIATIADGSRLNMAATRRLQLAAPDGGGLALLARPATELNELSAAAVRWLVKREPSPTTCPRWTVGLLRCKGVLSSGPAVRVADPKTGEGGGSLIVEYSRGARVVRVPPDLADRPGAAETQKAGWLTA